MRALNGRRIRNALLAGIEWFSHFRKEIDQLNVFPVPDGDTGKNMYYALQAAQKEIEASMGLSAAEVAWAAARGAMMGGRGCSGMILSGFFAGFAEGVGDRRALSAQDLARAFQVGSLRARERIDHPQEGTILSVGEAAAHEACEVAKRSNNLIDVLVAAWQGAEEALQLTTKQLKVLREHEVVDAGGMGLTRFIEGMVRFNFRQPLTGHAIPGELKEKQFSRPVRVKVKVPEHKFCTEFIISEPGLTLANLKDFLQPLGKELMIATAEPGTYKVHIHSKDAEALLRKAASVGRILWQKIDNMELQHQHAFADPEP